MDGVRPPASQPPLLPGQMQVVSSSDGSDNEGHPNSNLQASALKNASAGMMSGSSPELNTLYEAVLMAGKQRGAAAAAAAGTFLVIQHTYRGSGENLDRQVSRFHMY